MADEFVVAWPTLWVVPDWIERHCPVPDREAKGQPLELYRWQLWCTVNHYRVKPSAQLGQLATAFHYRRSQVVMSQKSGKGPWGACIIANEAVGPAVFDGWATGDEAYVCAEHGCPCGWVYEYQVGEPMGRPWATPLIQLLANSVDQTDNVYRPLQAIVRTGPLAAQLRVGEGFIRTPNDGRIDVVTSSARSRLGNPISFALQDETGTYTKTNGMTLVAQTQRRSLAGMGGRSIETTNAPDPSEDSTAQQTMESSAPDVFKFYPEAPRGLSFKNKVERRRIFRAVYAGCKHIDLDGIEAECLELMERDPAQAERFFGNRMVAGVDSWMDGEVWDRRALVVPRVIRRLPRCKIALAFDGSDVDDCTGIRAETMDSYQFTPTYAGGKPAFWNPADYSGQVPRLEVKAAMAEIMEYYNVLRLYPDPPYWESEIDEWIDLYGDKKVIPWHTRRIVQMNAAADRLMTDLLKKDTNFTHDGCKTTSAHMRNARKAARPGGTVDNPRYVLVKASPSQKIDMCINSILVHEAASDCIAAGLATQHSNYVYTA